MEKATPQNFDNGFSLWNEYQQAPWGKLRYRVAAANLERHLPQRPLHFLDVGGGNGRDAVALARQGHTVTVLDFSTVMLRQGRQLAQEANVSDRITFQEGDVSLLAENYPQPTFDAALCHNLLQYVDEPTAVLTTIFNALHINGILSLMITNPFVETYALALREYDLPAALAGLGQRTRYVPMFDTTIQRYTDEEMAQMLASVGFTVAAQYGVRCICDFIADNERKSDPDFYAQLEELELALSERHPYKLLARFYQFMCQKSGFRRAK